MVLPYRVTTPFRNANSARSGPFTSTVSRSDGGVCC